MWKSLVTRFKQLPIASLDAPSAALTVAAITGGEPISTATLGSIAALALTVKTLTGKWSDDQANEFAQAVDKLVRDERNDVRELIRLFDLPTDGVGTNESALVLLANGLREEIRANGIDQAAMDARFNEIKDYLDRIEQQGAKTQEVAKETRDIATETRDLVKDDRIKDETIASLVQQLAAKDARIAQLESVSQETPEQVVREAVEAVVADDSLSDEELANLTPDELQRRMIAKSEQLEQRCEQLENEAAAEEEALIENDRRILHFVELRGDVTEVANRIERILARRPEDLDAINRRGHLRRLQGNLPGAEADYRRIEKLAGDDRGVLSAAYGNLGLVYETRGDLALAEETLLKSLAIEEELGGKQGIASSYGNIGSIYRIQGDLPRAEKMHQKALAMNKELGREEGMASQYGNLGLVYLTRGNLTHAEEMLKKALAIDEELGHKEGVANQNGNLGLVYTTRGDLTHAEAVVKKALAIDEELGRKEGMATQYGNLGLIYMKQGNLPRAEEMLKQALALNEELGRKEGVANQYGNLGLIYRTRGNLSLAEEMHLKALAIDEELGRKEGLASEYGNLGLVYLARGDLVRAEAMFKKSLAIDEKLGRKEGMASQYGNLGSLCGQQERFAEACEWYRKCCDLFHEMGVQHMVEKTEALMAEMPIDGES